MESSGTIAEGEKETHRLDGIDMELLDTVLAFLKPFYDASIDMEASKQPTIHMVFLWRRKLLTHLGIDAQDGPIISKMKEQAKRYLKNNWITKDIHNVAVSLHAFLRSVINLSDNPNEDGHIDETENTKNLIRSKNFREGIVGENFESPMKILLNIRTHQTSSLSENLRNSKNLVPYKRSPEIYR